MGWTLSAGRAIFGWWKRHPWATAWVALILFFFVAASCHEGCNLTGPVLAKLLLFLLLPLLWVASVIQGVRVTGRRSKQNAVATLLGVSLASALVVLPFFSHSDSGPRRWKAQADVRAMAEAVRMFKEDRGRLPLTLNELTQRGTNAKGEPSFAFMASVPRPPHGWSEYRYEVRSDGTFTITSAGDGWTVKAPD